MASMGGTILALVAIGAGLVVGWLLFSAAGEASATVNSFFGFLGRVAWIIIGIVAIFGGFYVVGVLLIALGLFLAMGHWMILKESDIRAMIAGD